MSPRRRPAQPRERGFVLIVVLLLIIVLLASVGIALREAGVGLREAGLGRSRETVHAALDHGLNAALGRLQTIDPRALANPANDWDIFDQPRPAGTNEFLPVELWPSDPSMPSLRVRYGLRPGQRTRAPAGEDVRSSYGIVMEVQLSVDNTAFGAQAEDRVAVGILVPHQSSHSN